ncbi:MAG: bifunctional demethylmenaquinone methyltransferase/2-methoxy-6-polyprenyl-1,4-benzoquinol methylase UbiE [Cyanobacteria bacterium P01_E01_bin.45]
MPSSTYSSSDRVRDLFDRIAPEYDRLNTLLSLGLHRVWKSMAVKWTEPELGDDALDICCGSGDVGLLMARAVGPSGQVIGIDISENLLAIARHRAKLSLRERSTSWVCGDALQLPFEGDRFDAVTMGYGLRNVVDIPQALREIWRVLKPGAKAAILDFQHLETGGSPTVAERFQQVYLERIVVPAATALGLQQEYEYIQASLLAFPTSAEQQQLAVAAGFPDPVYFDVAGGLMGVLVLQKPTPAI